MSHYIDRNRIDFDRGTIAYDTYYVEGAIKIGEVRSIYIDGLQCLTIALSKEYKNGDTITLKKRKSTREFVVIYYDKFSEEDNLKLLEAYCRRISPAKQKKFCYSHAHKLQQILGKKFNSFMLGLIFKLGCVPDGFELVYGGNKIITNPNGYKTQWQENPNGFKVLLYN